MKKRRLGNSDLLVSPVGLGCMGFSHASGDPVPEDIAIETLRQAYEAGYDFFDTAEAYTGIYPDGRISYNEELVGKALKDVRDKVVIATKMGVSHNADRSLRLDSSPETIRRSLEKSLERLGTDYVDLYYQHRIDPRVEPEAVAETMGELIREGKIRYWGISETTEEYLRRANAVTPVTAIENRYSMMARWHEAIFPVCEELNIAYVAFSPMANGFLTGAYNPDTKFEGSQDYRTNMPQYTEEGYAKAKGLLDLLAKMSEEKNCTRAQLSLAWMINKKPYIVPIPGSRKIERLKANFEAGNIILSKEEIAAIDARLDQMQFDVFGGHSAKK
ncbi:MAG: aldo/keto reductase [Solobacterium sp.]|nr:aldo/keto reductase [Solobacterium sp.]